jgi:UDP-N-acetyl-D-galactosamine dehydrogenase
VDLSDKTIAVIGLGYVGLPLAVEFGKMRPVVGFDVQHRRIAELREGIDRTGELDPQRLSAATQLRYSSAPEDLCECGVFIVSVPTPVDRAKRPDLGMLESATATVGKAMGPGAVVIYESTVYPGCTRNICVPILERMSGLRFNEGFFAGYSPERINPGDKDRRLPNIVKVTSGSTPAAAEAIDELYRQIVPAGTHKASSIEVAEAAKVIENTQRDLNIALMNELAIIFHRIGLDTREVLAAAGTKWNFLPFQPGLVGGHCIGVDPYYLTHRAEEIGYHPEVILAGRRINDSMGNHIADRVVRMMLVRDMPVARSRILVLGITFKEDCPDVRNSRVVDVIAGLRELNASVDVWDPCADVSEVRVQPGVTLVTDEPQDGQYDAVILAVAHRRFLEIGVRRIRAFGKPGAVFFDVKSAFPKGESDGRL